MRKNFSCAWLPSNTLFGEMFVCVFACLLIGLFTFLIFLNFVSFSHLSLFSVEYKVFSHLIVITHTHTNKNPLFYLIFNNLYFFKFTTALKCCTLIYILWSIMSHLFIFFYEKHYLFVLLVKFNNHFSLSWNNCLKGLGPYKEEFFKVGS